MKRTLFTTALLSFAAIINAQVFLIDSFTLTETDGAYGIYADIDCNEANVFFFDMQAPKDQQRVQMKLWGNYIDGFIQSLRSAQKKYQEWSKVAQENNVKLLSKDVSGASFTDKVVYFTENDKWYQEKGVDIKCKFIVSSVGSCHLALQTDYMTSEEVVQHGFSIGSFGSVLGRWNIGMGYSKTSVIRYCGGASLTFSSSEEIDMFIQKLYDAQQWKKNNKEMGKKFK